MPPCDGKIRKKLIYRPIINLAHKAHNVGVDIAEVRECEKGRGVHLEHNTAWTLLNLACTERDTDTCSMTLRGLYGTLEPEK